MIDADFLSDLESGKVDRHDAIVECVHAYRTAWAQIGLIRELFDQLGEEGTAFRLSEAQDLLQGAMDDHYSIDMDGEMHVRSAEVRRDGPETAEGGLIGQQPY